MAGEAATAANVPAGRTGTPQDVAGAVLCLAGRGAYTTGAILPVGRGISVQTGPELFGHAN